MVNLRRRKRLASKSQCLKTLRAWARKVKRTTRVCAELRQKNSLLVKELQKERMKSSSLHNELNFLQSENFNVLTNLLANRGTLADFLVQTSEVQTCIQGLAAWLVHGSSWLARIQVSAKKIESQIMNMEDQQPTDSRNGTPVSTRRRALLQRRKLKPQETSKDDLDVIEEVSHENSQISPNLQLIPKASGSKYERRCKKGMRLLLSTRTQTNRKSGRLSLKSNSNSNGSSLNEKPETENADESQLDVSNEAFDQSKLDVSQVPLDGSRLDESDESSDESQVNKSDKALDESKLDVTADGSKSDNSMDASQELSDAETSDKLILPAASSCERSPNNQTSRASDCSRRSSSSGCSGKAVRYSDVLKSGNSSVSNESNQNDNLIVEENKYEANKSLENSVSPQSNLERTYLDSPEDKKPDLSSLSSITVRRGANRHNATSESVKNNLSSCSTTPKRIMRVEYSNIRGSPDSDLESNKSSASVNSITYRRNYKQRESFTFYAVPEWSNSSKRKSMNESTIKAMSSNEKSMNKTAIRTSKKDKENKEPQETIVPQTKEKKKGRKAKKVSPDNDTDCPLNNSYQLFADENSRISEKKTSRGKNLNVTSSTPLDSVKPKKNRQPLETIVSSTRMSANESKLSNSNRYCGLSETLSLSPILNCPKDRQSLLVDETGPRSFDSSSTINNDSSGSQRPRRNAAKNKNYKELPLTKKMRRHN